MHLTIVMLGSKSQPHLAFKDCAIIIYSLYITEKAVGGILSDLI